MILKFFVYIFIVVYFLLETNGVEKLELQFSTNHKRDLSEQNVDSYSEEQTKLENSTNLKLGECSNASEDKDVLATHGSKGVGYEERCLDLSEKINVEEMKQLWKHMNDEQIKKDKIVDSMICNWEKTCLIHAEEKDLTEGECCHTMLGCFKKINDVGIVVRNCNNFNEFKKLEEEGCLKGEYLAFIDKKKKEMEEDRKQKVLNWKRYLYNLMGQLEQYTKNYEEKGDEEKK